MNGTFSPKTFEFWLGFFSAIGLFIVSNLVDFIIASTPGDSVCFGCYWAIGKPFAMVETGAFIWAGVFANIFIVLVLGYVLGLIYKRLFGIIKKRS